MTVLTDRAASPGLPYRVVGYLADDEVPESCQRVAILHGPGSRGWTNETDMLNKPREKAGSPGANAVHLRTMEDAGTGERGSWVPCSEGASTGTPMHWPFTALTEQRSPLRPCERNPTHE